MERLKYFFKIFGIALGCVLGVVVILGVLTLLIPNFYVFGYKFIVGSLEQEEIVISQNATDYDITIKCEDYNVNIVADAELEGVVAYSYAGSNYGFANVAGNRLIVENDANSLNIVLREPRGLIVKSNNTLQLRVNPETIYSLTVVCEKGNITTENVLLKKINAFTTSGNISIIGEGTQNLTSLNLKTNSGEIDFSSYETLDVDSICNITLGDGILKFQNLNASMIIRGKNCEVYANDIQANQGITMLCSHGKFIANDINCMDDEFIIVTDNLEFTSHNIIANFGVTGGDGNITIKSIIGEANIKVGAGNVDIEKAFGNVFVVATTGNIYVEKYYQIGQFVTTTGNIIANCFSEYNTNFYSTLATESGTIKFENKINTSTISVTKEGSAKAKYWEVAQEGEIKHTIYIPNGKANIGIMARATDGCRLRLVGKVDGSLNDVILYANDFYIYHHITSESYVSQASFECFGGDLSFTTLDPQEI